MFHPLKRYPKVKFLLGNLPRVYRVWACKISLCYKMLRVSGLWKRRCAAATTTSNSNNNNDDDDDDDDDDNNDNHNHNNNNNNNNNNSSNTNTNNDNDNAHIFFSENLQLPVIFCCEFIWSLLQNTNVLRSSCYAVCTQSAQVWVPTGSEVFGGSGVAW